jgi:uncharacterized protein YbjQ (UPF0145 family)
MAEEEPARGGADPIERLIVTTGDGVAGHRIVKYLAIVRGIVVRAPSERQSFKNTFRSSASDKLREYAEICEAARHDAFVKMVASAEELGADAIIGMRYDANELIHGASEVVAYGTAVTLVSDG